MNKQSDLLEWMSCIAIILVGSDIVHILKSAVHFDSCMLSQFALLSIWLVALIMLYRFAKYCIKERQKMAERLKEENIDMH